MDLFLLDGYHLQHPFPFEYSFFKLLKKQFFKILILSTGTSTEAFKNTDDDSIRDALFRFM